MRGSDRLYACTPEDVGSRWTLSQAPGGYREVLGEQLGSTASEVHSYRGRTECLLSSNIKHTFSYNFHNYHPCVIFILQLRKFKEVEVARFAQSDTATS